ncbi:MAG TPA: Imm52 family immunity protein, partial [Myxococcaceae bacterium]
MIETYYLGAYWGPRQEDAAACAQRTAHMVRLLEPVDPLFAQWFKSAKSLKEALKRPLDSDLEGLRKYIQRMVMKDDRRVPMPDGGFHLWLWNGESGGGDVWLSIGCGGYWEQANNRCVLRAPHKGPVSARVLTASFQMEVLRAIATTWDPDSGVAISNSHQDIIEKKCPDLLVGWVTYLSHRLGR